MANIATLLASILTTRYGRDMRQDLHDAIEAVNNDTENALGKSLSFTTNTRKLKLLAKDNSVLSEVVIPGGGSGGGSVDSVNGLFPDENGNVELNLDDINDVDITSAADGDALVYDAESGKWVNGSGGGGTTDYTDLTNKPSVNGVTLSGNKTSADLGIFAPTIASPTSGQVIKYDGTNWVNGSVSGGSNRNLLDNPWFTVNQKGFSSKTSSSSETNVRFLDRWKAEFFVGAPLQIVLNSDNTLSLKINKNSSYGSSMREIRMLQEIDNYEDLIGKQCTLSIMLADGTIYSITKVVPSLGQSYQNITIGTGKSIELFFDNRNNGMYKRCIFMRYKITSEIFTDTDAYEELKIKAMKLEFGAESTLAQDTEPNYTTELLKCQRYFYPLGGKSYNAMVSPLQQTRQWFTITLPTEMRAVPTLSGSLTSEGISGSSSMTNTVTSSNITVTKTQDIDFNFTTSGNYNLCSSARVGFASGSYLSAEL